MMNRICIMGRLTAAPELRVTGSGASVCSFTIACDSLRKDAGGEKITDFFDCVAWRGTAEWMSRHFVKGERIAIDGHLQTRTWEDKSGVRRKATEIVADSVDFADGKKDKAADRPGTAAAPDAGYARPSGGDKAAAMERLRQYAEPSQRSITGAEFEYDPNADDLPF